LPKRSLVRGLEHLSPAHRAKFEASLAKIPADIQQLAAKHGVTIEIQLEVRTGERGRIDYGGLYHRSERKVVVGPKGLDHPDSDVLLHEFGHAWDHVLGDVSKTPPYKALHREAKPRVPYFKTGSPPNSTGAQELFAEGFAQHYGGYTKDFFTLTDNMRTIYDQLRHNVRTGVDLSGEALMELACHDAACAPPPVGTGGSKPGGPSRGVLSPKASERTRQPVAVVDDIYDLRKHGVRELFDGQINAEYGFDMEEEVAFLGAGTGWLAQGYITNKTGEHVAYFERWLHMDEQGKLVATHETLKVNDDQQGKGIAQMFNDHLMNWYQRVGVDRIELVAGMEVGPYAWARQGYRVRGVEGGENRKRWVADRIDRMVEQARYMGASNRVKYEESQAMVRDLVALKNASNRGEDIQPIHVASIGQGNDTWTWEDDHGSTWLGKSVLIDWEYQSDDFGRSYDAVYYLEGKEVPATVASAANFLLTR
jgi:hypothetical protein